MTSYIENNVILLFLPHFRSNLTCLGRRRYPEAPISDKICLICITQARFRGYKPFSEVSGLQWLHILKILWFCVFDPISGLIWPVLDIYGILKAPMSDQICLICITPCRFQGYKTFCEVSGSQSPDIMIELWFCGFDPNFALFLTFFGP